MKITHNTTLDEVMNEIYINHSDDEFLTSFAKLVERDIDTAKESSEDEHVEQINELEGEVEELRDALDEIHDIVKRVADTQITELQEIKEIVDNI